MKKQRSLDSREQNRYKQTRRRQRKAKSQLHRDYLLARLHALHQALETPLPPEWPILYPEVSEAIGLPSPSETEWAVFETAAPWFTWLSRQRGRHFSRKQEPAISNFTLDLICLTHSVMNAVP